MDYSQLTTAGNIAFYESCEVTELFLCRKSDKVIFNFFTLATLEEQPFSNTEHQFLCKPIKINEEYTLGIQRYKFSTQDAERNFIELKENNKWSFNEKNSSIFPKLKSLPKQFIPSIEGNRLNHILKNNFHNGSYILEFFDEEKTNIDFLLEIGELNKLNELSKKIKQYVPIDLSIVRDRIGNFIYQFPITILEKSANALKTWDGVQIKFSWHPSISNPPDCLLQVESTIDRNYMGATIEEYNKTEHQVVNIGNLDQINNIKIWRKEPSLILSTFSGTYIKDFNLNMGLISPEPRIFEIEGNVLEVQITNNNLGNKKIEKANYTKYITNNLYDAEKKHLEKSLSFKQYKGRVQNSLKDLQLLIQQKGENGICIWDPFLSPADIFKTLYYSTHGGTQLKAIGSINDAVKNVYQLKGKTVTNIISDYQKAFDNPQNNNHHLNIEFRIQHTNFGWGFHDRFLIFPSGNLKRPQVYSLGTSVNSYGNNHHILQEVSHPQPVVDAFNELWDELNHNECIVWRFPK